MGIACSFEKSVCWNTRHQVNKRESEGVFRNCSSLGFGLTQVQPCDCPVGRTKKTRVHGCKVSSRERSWWEPQHQAWAVAMGREGFCLSLNKYCTASNESAGNLLLNPGYHRDITVEFYLVSAFPISLFENVFFRNAEFLKCLPEWGHFQYEVKNLYFSKQYYSGESKVPT